VRRAENLALQLPTEDTPVAMTIDHLDSEAPEGTACATSVLSVRRGRPSFGKTRTPTETGQGVEIVSQPATGVEVLSTAVNEIVTMRGALLDKEIVGRALLRVAAIGIVITLLQGADDPAQEARQILIAMYPALRTGVPTTVATEIEIVTVIKIASETEARRGTGKGVGTVTMIETEIVSAKGNTTAIEDEPEIKRNALSLLRSTATFRAAAVSRLSAEARGNRLDREAERGGSEIPSTPSISGTTLVF